MRPVLSITVAVLLVLTARVVAQQPPPAFRFERPIAAGGEGPRRLPVDVPLLVGGAPFQTASRIVSPATGETTVSMSNGLADLRLYDAEGREVGYLLVGHMPAVTTYADAPTLPIASVDEEKRRTSGFEADLGESLLVDRVRIDGLVPPFLKRATLEGSGDREHWTMLVAEGTVFDLPSDRLRQTVLPFSPGSYRYLRLTWDDTNSARLPRPAVVAVGKVPQGPPPPPLVAAVAVEPRPSEPRHSRFRVRLPGGHLPVVALDLDVGGGHVLRDASVYEARLSGAELAPVRLGRATIRRVVRDGVAASALRVPIQMPTEAQLDLVLEDGDNPPLDLRGATAVFAELPWIYLEAPAAALVARYGNPRLAPPRYDLEAERPEIQIEHVAEASWGEPRARSEATAPGPAPRLPEAGAEVDPSLFDYVRPIAPGSAGLVAIALDAGVLAHSAGEPRGFADVRVLDARDRQVPYVVERSSEPLSIDVRLERLPAPPAGLPSSQTARSVYRAALPHAGLPQLRLVLSTPARVFNRNVTIAVERPRDRQHRDAWLQVRTAMRWVHADQDLPTPPLTLSLGSVDTADLVVVVDEGDNAPLPLARARILLPSYRLRLYREGGAALRLAYGRRDLDRPQYDLALLGPQVLGAPAADVAPGPEPTGAAGDVSGLVSPRVFWMALALAVVVLVGLIGRLLRGEGTLSR